MSFWRDLSYDRSNGTWSRLSINVNNCKDKYDSERAESPYVDRWAAYYHECEASGFNVPEPGLDMDSLDDGPEYPSQSLAASPGDKPDKTSKILSSADPLEIPDSNHYRQPTPRSAPTQMNERSMIFSSPSAKRERAMSALPDGSTHEDDAKEPSASTTMRVPSPSLSQREVRPGSRRNQQYTKEKRSAVRISPSPPTKRRRVVVAAGSTYEGEVGESSTGIKTKFFSLSRREVYEIISGEGVKDNEGRTLCPLECGDSSKHASDIKRHASSSACPNNPYKEPIRCPKCNEGVGTRRDSVSRHLQTVHDYQCRHANPLALKAFNRKWLGSS